MPSAARHPQRLAAGKGCAGCLDGLLERGVHHRGRAGANAFDRDAAAAFCADVRSHAAQMLLKPRDHARVGQRSEAVVLVETALADGPRGRWIAAGDEPFDIVTRVFEAEPTALELTERFVHARIVAIAVAREIFVEAGVGLTIPVDRGQAVQLGDQFVEFAFVFCDRIRGVFSRPEHKLADESYTGKVLVLDAAKGGVATAWMLYEMTSRGVKPAALVLNRANPIMVQGAALAGFTMISGFDLDITKAIPNGAEVEIDPVAERPFIRVV